MLMCGAMAMALPALARGAEIVVDWTPPAGVHVASASAIEVLHRNPDTNSLSAANNTVAGTISPPGVHFSVQNNSAYELSLKLDDGTELRGVNMNWYSPAAPDPNAGAASDDDRHDILQIVHDSTEPNGFFNHADLLVLRASSERAVGLVQLVRDLPFHSDNGNEVIWRVELWYLKNENGGWVKVPQVSKMILRQRLGSHSAFVAAVSHLRWVPAMGDVEVGADVQKMTIELPGDAGVSGTRIATTEAAPR